MEGRRLIVPISRLTLCPTSAGVGRDRLRPTPIPYSNNNNWRGSRSPHAFFKTVDASPFRILLLLLYSRTLSLHNIAEPLRSHLSIHPFRAGRQSGERTTYSRLSTPAPTTGFVVDNATNAAYPRRMRPRPLQRRPSIKWIYHASWQ